MNAPSLLVFDTPGGWERAAVELICNRLAARPRLRVLLPTGRTPLGVYRLLRDRARRCPELFEHMEVLQLDEYVGCEPDRSFGAYLQRELDGVPVRALHLIGLDGDPHTLAGRHARRLAEAPIDLALLGVGRNGHVAFNEPGSDPGAGVHVTELTSSTREANAPDFDNDPQRVPRHAITVGLGDLRACREVLICASGESKQHAIGALMQASKDSRWPCTHLADHPHLTVMCDVAAAGMV